MPRPPPLIAAQRFFLDCHRALRSWSSARRPPYESKYFDEIDWSIGVDLEQWPAAGDGLGDLLVPELVTGSDAIEVSRVPRSGPRRIPGPCDRLIASTEDLDHSTR